MICFIYRLYSVFLICLCATTVYAQAPLPANSISQSFQRLLYSSNSTSIDKVIRHIGDNWDQSYIPQLLEILYFNPNHFTETSVIHLLTEKTQQNFGRDINQWYRWLWNQPEHITQDYADFKRQLYQRIDPRFGPYFKDRQATARIRLDEIRWGGVRQDGIPPLRKPKMLDASDADYLADEHIVFGIKINGDARAYPKRILAWHEMFVDTIGGVDIAGVYCTLCGTVIPYKTKVNGKVHQLGTSGFLYRSNKLMYDKETQSLWSTMTGKPVVGPLVDKGIQLDYVGVVTSTWAEWKRRHPNTRVLSLDTGHRRDYGEGIAYQDYFATDQLMFNTPFEDKRLNNKQEVLALRFAGSPMDQLAIDTDFLAKHPLYTGQIGRQAFIVLSDSSGANRVYDPENIDFVAYDQDSQVTDAQGNTWAVTEEQLVSKSGRVLQRLPYHRAFWFGWQAAYPQTQLIQ
ncbi:MAG: DUF3179 domain-containing protein [Pseudomonadota bacterium]